MHYRSPPYLFENSQSISAIVEHDWNAHHPSSHSFPFREECGSTKWPGFGFHRGGFQLHAVQMIVSAASPQLD